MAYAGIIVDTVSNPNNIWQIGRPQKNAFDPADSAPNAMVTGTINVYPTNDTSSFIFVQEVTSGWATPQAVGLFGYYKVDSDTLTDFGVMEISVDQGISWINVLTDTSYDFFSSWGLLSR